ncbi:urease accessory protein UreF [Flammeovirga aprica]|uniref:Urease accessory protein UreF n=1 Tax=Flammeovirga aprica JL-4 TaxID=694437 RepID=A0A7X9RYD2_9BACT|nr:urease accessory UreF family protein [Flammeovirga aprica]NME70996.1 hypothetical protein [Flammeovirga aprica JL-4]
MLNTELYQILHIADSAFPIGGYAYSNGLEYAVKSGIISDVKGLNQYLKDYLHQIIKFDMAFVKEAFEAEAEELPHLCESYDVMLLNPAIKKAGVVLGKNWKRAIKQLHGEDVALWPVENTDPDFLIIFGYTCKLLGYSLENVCILYLFMIVRDQLSAIIRLGTLGPSQGHKMQSDLLKELEETFTIDQIPSVEQAYKCTYIVEMAQLSHKYLYTKLFQN